MTWSSPATLPSMAVMSDCTCGSVTSVPLEVAKTICSVSPEILGEAAWRRAMASVDSVWGSEKLLVYAVPVARDRRVMPTRATTQKRATRRRWRTHQLARDFIGGDSSLGVGRGETGGFRATTPGAGLDIRRQW